MRTKTWLTTLSAMLVAGALHAQEPTRLADDDPALQEGRPQIRVLENPYDIAKFYRSPQAPSYFGFFGYDQQGPYGLDRYPIASFYRQRPPSRFGHSRFWTAGYAPRRRGGVYFSYRRTIGQNGDLFLLAPTILAPVGPLTGAFYEGR